MVQGMVAQVQDMEAQSAWEVEPIMMRDLVAWVWSMEAESAWVAESTWMAESTWVMESTWATESTRVIGCVASVRGMKAQSAWKAEATVVTARRKKIGSGGWLTGLAVLEKWHPVWIPWKLGSRRSGVELQQVWPWRPRGGPPFEMCVEMEGMSLTEVVADGG